MEEEPKLQNLEEDDPKSQSLEEQGSMSQSLEEDPTPHSLKEPKLQSLEKGGPKSQSLKEDYKSQNVEEGDSKSQSLKEDPKSLSLEENPKSLSLEEDPKSQSLEGRDKIAFSELNENSLQFLDSIDGYLTLLDSLSWTLRQGWLQLASARHSMGESRVSSALLDLKSHNASTFLQVTQQSDTETEQIHHFTLRKWASSDNDNGAPLMNMSPQIRQRKDKDGRPPPLKAETAHQHQLQKERTKSLLMFGVLVLPKLRAAQLSFESALDALVEIANMRSLMLSVFDKVREELEAAEAK
ncbi:uncharacterized protein LOC126607681 [Malus sylvestris]|uniref:uncharacterized protein LOC126607681 n=1 Tax=Malus sylvestris TaxID=3752 RepID=UPI0021AC60B6|nr:uncharacterized protein LOC126607681 [Malus sylvestris]XP_050131339.1 uncharacterized protein LOC126607681 [Malus sylvestris]XP_050131346.1 uncharacterized protein LOC126607681 [Malus sylvestris]XP_050131352.1 uncharacterized protein LOC126607681 [Malus sylvestris]XP_050131361.1 uncharacterized protein LOC126607681 [Malus sylvestris]XP_050131369.1 uncharacterized protein LOC126607681 [Malus sylvestris]XP_050131376.1 uncharacterized protein LOC126607681 [Malus sylvestris]XP_050131383.1 unc